MSILSQITTAIISFLHSDFAIQQAIWVILISIVVQRITFGYFPSNTKRSILICLFGLSALWLKHLDGNDLSQSASARVHRSYSPTFHSSQYAEGSYIGWVLRTIEDWSDARKRSCGVHHGLTSDGNIRWRYLSMGRDCDTTVEKESLKGAIKQHLNEHPDCYEGQMCVDLTNGKAWNGFLMFGPADSWDSTMYCGPRLDFETGTWAGREGSTDDVVVDVL